MLQYEKETLFGPLVRPLLPKQNSLRHSVVSTPQIFVFNSQEFSTPLHLTTMEGFYALLLLLKYFDYGLAGKPKLGLCNGMDLVGIFYSPTLRLGPVLWSSRLLPK